MRSPLRLEDLAIWKRSGRSATSDASAGQESWPVLDLLRETRREIGQQTIAAVLADRRRLLLQGTGVGAVLLGVVLGITALVFLRHQLVKAQMGQRKAAALGKKRARHAIPCHDIRAHGCCAVNGHAHKTLFEFGLMAHPRRHLLAHIAALAE